MNFMIETLNSYQFNCIIKSGRMNWTGCMKKREFQSESLKVWRANWSRSGKTVLKEMLKKKCVGMWTEFFADKDITLTITLCLRRDWNWRIFVRWLMLLVSYFDQWFILSQTSHYYYYYYYTKGDMFRFLTIIRPTQITLTLSWPDDGSLRTETCHIWCIIINKKEGIIQCVRKVSVHL
jgi:hypothetical protein